MMIINVIYLDISVSNIPITQGTDYSVYARSQSEPELQYNTCFDCLSANTEWFLQGFQVQCSIVWCLYESVILNQCVSFKDRFEDPWSVKNTIWPRWVSVRVKISIRWWLDALQWHIVVSIDLINFSESHTQIQPFRPLPCDNYHDHNILTYICPAVVARLLVLAHGTANARMQVWNGSICALGAVGEPAIIVTLMMMSSEHNRFLYYMHEMYQLCWTLTVSPKLISIIHSFIPLPWCGVHHHNITVYIC